MTVRELIMALLLNANLEDRVCVEIQCPKDDGDSYRFVRGSVRHVFSLDEGETIIESDEEVYED